MRRSDSRSEAAFRRELVSWLDEHQPGGERASDPPRSSGHIPEWAATWQRELRDAGWLVPRWPRELGGRDATAVEQLIYLEELSERRLPRSVNPQGLDVCAPTLVDHGTGAQLDEWVPATLEGRMSWCVAVGEALADDGDGPRDVSVSQIGDTLTLNGSMTAPAGAADADRCLCGVRLETPGRREDAVAVAVCAVDLAAPGVARPEPVEAPRRVDAPGGTLAFTDVRVSPSDLVGEAGQGWQVLQSARARLRSMRWITSLFAMLRALEALAAAGRSRGLADDGVFRDTLAGLHVEASAARALAYRAMARQTTGRPNPELAMLPLVVSQVEERVYRAGVEALGADGIDRGIDGPTGWPSGSWADEWAIAMAQRTASGGLGAERERVAARALGTLGR